MKKYILLFALCVSVCWCFRVFSQNQKLDSLWNLYKQAKHDTTRINLLNKKIGYFYESINPDSAIFLYNKAIDMANKNISQKTPNKIFFLFSEAKSFFYIGIVKKTQGHYDESLEYLIKSLKIFTELKDKKEMSGCYNNIGSIYKDQGNYEQAFENYHKSLKISEELDDKKGISMCYNNIGLVQYSKGSYDTAIEYYLKSLQINEGINDKKGMSNCYCNIGIVHYYMKNYDNAIEFYQKSLEIEVELKSKKGISSSYNNIGGVYLAQAKLQKSSEAIKNSNVQANEYFIKSLKIKEELNDKRGISMCYNNIGLVHSNLGNYSQAINFYLKSLKIYEELNDKNKMCSVYTNIASINISLFDSVASNKKQRLYFLNEALKFGKKAFDLSKEIKAIPREKVAASVLMTTYKKLGNFKKSLEYAEIYMATKDSLFSEEKTKSLAEMSAKYETEKKVLTIQKLINEKLLQNETIARKDSENRKQRILIFSFIAGFIIILIFSILLFRLFTQKKKAFKLLSLKNEEILQKNEEINTQKDEIENQRDIVVLQKNEIESQRDIVILQKEHIETIHKEVTDSINYAKYIQEAVIPSNFKIDKLLDDYFILFKPKNIVSGDFYWINKVNDWLIIAVADCTGHGVPGAFMSMLGISFLNEIVRKNEVKQANELLNLLRISIIDALSQTGKNEEQKDGMDMSLVVIMNQEPSSKFQVSSPKLQESEKVRLRERETASANNQSYHALQTTNLKQQTSNVLHAQWAGANNPLWIIKSPKSQNQSLKNQEIGTLDDTLDLGLGALFLELKADKMPIAINDNMNDFTNHELILQKGDILYLMTDGYEDQFGGSNGKKFLSKNLKELIIANCLLTMEEQKQVLEKTLVEWIGEREQIDDITILGIKI